MKPNLLFIITDQHRYDAVGYTNRLVKTPNIDQLASQSVVCHQAIVQSPQCQPSRASLLTGLYPDNLNMWWNETRLNLDNVTIGNILSNNGYHTGYFGKMHIDSQLNYRKTCENFGFKESFLTEDWMNLLNQQQQTNPDLVQTIRRQFFSIMKNGNDPDIPDCLAPWTGKFSSPQLHHEEVIAHRAAQFIKTKTNNPYACFVSFHGPHPPYASPPPYNNLYNFGDIPLPNRIMPSDYGHILSAKLWHHIKSQYYGAVAWIDQYIGQLLQLIDDNTIVVFTSDHGDILGDHGLFSKGIYTFDGNIRVPLIIKNNKLKHIDYNYPVQLIDVLPTLLSMMDIKTNVGVDGIDLADAMSNNIAAQDFTFSAIGVDNRIYMVRSSRYKYVYANQSEQFYDLINDPKEQHNVINQVELSTAFIRHKKALAAHLSGLNKPVNAHSNIMNVRSRATNINYFM
jgi:arylsulfatase A-like enzyme